MPDRLENGGAESASWTLPTFDGNAERSADLPMVGSYSWKLPCSRFKIFGSYVSTESSLLWNPVLVLPGITFTLHGWLNAAALGGGGYFFSVSESTDDPHFSGAIFVDGMPNVGAPDVNGWSEFSIDYVPTTTQAQVFVRSLFWNGSGNGILYVDAISLEGGLPLAVMISEFAVRAVVARLQAALNAEIAYVKSEAALGYDLPAVTGWRAYDAGVATPDVVEAEVFERDSSTFPSNTYDLSAWTTGARTRVISTVRLRIGLNHANRGDADGANATLTASRMVERTRLYAAAILRTIRNDPTCGYGANITVEPVELRVNVDDRSRLSGDVRRVDRVEFDIDVHLQESSTGETTPGGAALPSATLETP